MSGKAVSGALRGHFLIESALTTKLLHNFFKEELGDCADENIEIIIEWSEESVVFTSFDIKKIDELCEIIKEPEKSTNHALESHDLRIVDENLKILKEMLATVSRTAKRWIQHLYYVQVVKLFIRVERTGNWNLHLIAISKMINLFAASDYSLYKTS